MAFAVSATCWAAAVVTPGTVSTNSTVVATDDRSRAAVATTSWKLVGSMVWPVTAGLTTNDFLFLASTTLASLPTFPACVTISATTASTASVSAFTTARTSREETSEVA